jgi:hypothetical protein
MRKRTGCTEARIQRVRRSASQRGVAEEKLAQKEKAGPRGREQCAGEPVLRRWSSPRFIRHSGLADTAHRTDGRVELLFNECRFNQR